jgi:hypothetical protein
MPLQISERAVDACCHEILKEPTPYFGNRSPPKRPTELNTEWPVSKEGSQSRPQV